MTNRGPEILGVVVGERGEPSVGRGCREMLSRVCSRVERLSLPAECTKSLRSALVDLAHANPSCSWAFLLPVSSPFVSFQFVTRMADLASTCPLDISVVSAQGSPLHALYRLSRLSQPPRDSWRIATRDEMLHWGATASAALDPCPEDVVALSERIVEVAREGESLRSVGFAHESSERDFVPGYLRLLRSGELDRRIELAREAMGSCRLCGRRCGVDRNRGELGVCESPAGQAWVSSAEPHFAEEAPLVGKHGSGTIFLTSCNLLCSFCQNAEISHGREGELITPRQLADTMLALQDQRWVHNINLVTPSHQLLAIMEAVGIAAREGLRVPLVWNCGGFESLDALRLLDGVVDIYMPDFKFWDQDVSSRLMRGAREYPEAARAAIAEMHRQVGPLRFDRRTGVALRGLLVRHLVMPNGLAGTAEFVRWLAGEVSVDTYVNVMGQYRPCFEAKEIEDIARRPTDDEVDEAILLAINEGLRVHVD